MNFYLWVVFFLSILLAGLLIYHSFVYLPDLKRRVALLELQINASKGKHHK